MNNLAGKDIGRYHVIEPLGQGGMASIYKAFDSILERNVAIKIIRSDAISGGEQAQFLLRFRREAKALAQLDHPYILKVLDYGEQEGIPYLVMPFIEGGTLKEKMGHPMPYQEAAALLAPIARALEYAHQLNIIHRDVKPANILISRSGAPILSDFGIAKMIGAGESTQLTATGVGIGTPDYMAPEQWMGKSDQFTDMYSLGIVFYQMVTGHLPFSADTPAAVMLKQMQDPLPRPGLFVPELPESVEQILFKVLAKEPQNRFPNMGVFADVLEKLAWSEKTLPAISQPTDASRATVLNPPPGYHPPAAVPIPIVVPPVHKRMAGRKVGLIILGGVAVLGVFLVAIAGLFFATRYISGNKPATGIPPTNELTPGNPLQAEQTQILSTQTQPADLTPLVTPYPTDTPEVPPPPSIPFALTAGKFHETDNLASPCGQELGSTWRMADWNDIVAYYQAGNSITAFVSALALSESATYWVTRNGNDWYSGQRHYFIQLNDHNLPNDFLSHANIDNHYIDLGSWHGLVSAILCYKNLPLP